MSLFVDTSVWSLAFRRNAGTAPEVTQLREDLAAGAPIFTTFAALPMILPDRDDHVAAAEIRNTCRRRGVQVGTIDALLVRLCVRHDLTMLTTDRDFERAARHVPFKRWLR